MAISIAVGAALIWGIVEYILASIVGVRTVLSYFLRMEIKQGVGK